MRQHHVSWNFQRNQMKYLSVGIITACLSFLLRSNVSAQRRIHGGRVARIDNHPYLVAIFQDDNFRCGGSILSEQFILTAALCVAKNSRNYMVKYGTSTPFDGVSGTAIKIAQRIFDPFKQTQYDIAILVPSAKIVFSKYAKPIALSANLVPNLFHATLAGWGITHDDLKPYSLLSVDVTLFDWSRCTDVYQDQFFPFFTVCGKAGYAQGPCDGDSGSPVVGISDGLQYGVFLSNPDCADPFYSDVYAHVPVFKKFIDHYSNHTAKWLN